uniref:Uncharacterized protein n=1 Tax=Kalanchoe fedtschenkoi TaxID=63787 RepID=A0A7N0UKS6_KALFE
MEVKIVSEIWLRPSSPTPPHLRHYRLSLIDLLTPGTCMPFIFFYKHDELINPNPQLELLKNKLSETLSDFYVLAGKIMEDDRTVVICNDDGVRYVEARVDCEMSEVMSHSDLTQMNTLLPSDDHLKFNGTHLASIQINVFECGSLAIGLCMSHKIMDAAGVGVFMNAWAAAARSSVDDSNPKPNFNSSSVFQAKNPWAKEVAALFEPNLKPGNFITRRLVFYPPSIEKLRDEVAAGVRQRPTRVQALSALLWKSHMKAFHKMKELKNEEKGITSPTSALYHTVNLRTRTRAALPITNHTVGNVAWYAAALTHHSLTPDLSFLSQKIREGIAKLDADFVDRLTGDEAEAKPAVFEFMKDITTPLSSQIAFASWCRLGLYDPDFGWGKPVWIGGWAVKTAAFYNRVVLIETGDGQGIEVWVNADEPELELIVNDPEVLRFALVDPSPLLNEIRGD